MKILQFCNEDKATSWQRTQAFKRLGVEIDVAYHYLLAYKSTILISIIRSIFLKLAFPLEYNNSNKLLIVSVSRKDYDIVLIEKCLALKPSTLKKIRTISPKSKIVCYTLDDFLGKGNRSLFFNKAIPLYDTIITNKEHNIEEYTKFGAKNIFYIKNAFSKDVHKPLERKFDISEEYYAEVCFIGAYERYRKDILTFLAKNGIKIKVWGWGKEPIFHKLKHKNITNMKRHVYFEEFSKTIYSSKICINFLRKSNRDTETTRSIEIPACGGFMIAENSLNHQMLFEDNFEAVFFNNKEDLLNKIRYFLKNDMARKTIALNGYNKCVTSDYSYEKQLKLIIEHVKSI